MTARLPSRIGFWLAVALILFVFLFPIAWMLLGSFKTHVQIISLENILIFTPTLENYNDVFAKYDFLQYIGNSVIIALGATGFSLLIGLPAAYGIARFKMHFLGLVILIGRIIPGIAFIIPWYILFSRLQLIDTHLALILAHMLIVLPLVIWIMIPMFEAIPSELEEAGLIDGCSRNRVFLNLILPISVPGMITASLLSIIFSWNNFLFSLVLSDINTKPLPVAIFNFLSYNEVSWGPLMAAASIITLPIMLIALISQRYVVSGFASGAVKG